MRIDFTIRTLHAFFACLGLTAIAHAAPLVSGDILIANITKGTLRELSPTGTLLAEYGGGSQVIGSKITPDGKLIASRVSPVGIDIFDPNLGGQVISFNTPEVSFAGDVSVFPDGNIAVVDQGSYSEDSKVAFYNSSGTFLHSTVLEAAAGKPEGFGSTVAPDKTLWVADYGSSAGTGQMFHMQEDGTSLATLTNLTITPSAVVIDPSDGTLWVLGYSGDWPYPQASVHHISPIDGQDLGHFNVELEAWYTRGIDFDLNSRTIVIDDLYGDLERYTRDGTMVGSIAGGAYGDFFLAVVAPEPSTLVITSVAAAFTTLLRRRQR